MSFVSTSGNPAASLFTALLPVLGAVFVAFLVTGVALPTLPLHVHHGLGLGALVVCLVAGAQFAASIVSRVWWGDYSDTRGAKRAVVAGLVMATGAGLSLLSLRACEGFIGAYTAFLDVSLGILSTLLGLIADAAGLGYVFFVSAVLVLCTVPITVRLSCVWKRQP